MLRLKLFLLALLLALPACLPLHADSYYITDEQMTQLETVLMTQEQLLKTQGEQIQSLSEQLKTESEFLKKSKNKELKNKIVIGSCCFAGGFVTGLVTGLLIFK